MRATIFWILFAKPEDLDLRFDGCGTRVIDALFFKFWKIKTIRFETNLTHILILRFNLRLVGYSIWSTTRGMSTSQF
jgi:hypothetical protein